MQIESYDIMELCTSSPPADRGPRTARAPSPEPVPCAPLAYQLKRAFSKQYYLYLTTYIGCAAYTVTELFGSMGSK